MRHRALAVEAVPMGKSLTGTLTHARIELPTAIRLVVSIYQGGLLTTPAPGAPRPLSRRARPAPRAAPRARACVLAPPAASAPTARSAASHGRSRRGAAGPSRRAAERPE
jgi:hypothetical protein